MRHLHQSQIDWSFRQPHVNRRRRKLQQALQRTPMEDPSWGRIRDELRTVAAPKDYAQGGRPWGVDGRVSTQTAPEGSRLRLLEEAKAQGLEVSDSLTKAQLAALLG